MSFETVYSLSIDSYTTLKELLGLPITAGNRVISVSQVDLEDALAWYIKYCQNNSNRRVVYSQSHFLQTCGDLRGCSFVNQIV